MPKTDKLRRATEVVTRLRTYVSQRRRHTSLSRKLKNRKASLPPETIVFFSPEAGLQAHYSVQCLVAKTLSEQGHSVRMIRCFGHLRRCPVNDCRQMPNDASSLQRKSVCLDCVEHSFVPLDSYGLEAIDLREYVSREDQAQVWRLSRSEEALSLDFHFGHLPAARIAYTNVVLNLKLTADGNFSDPVVRAQYQNVLHDTLITAIIADRLIATGKIKAFSFCNEYAIQHAVRFLAERAGIPTICLTHAGHCNIDRRRVELSKTLQGVFQAKRRENWAKWRELTLPPHAIAEVERDLQVRFQGGASHLFSPPKTLQAKSIHERLSLDRKRKLLVAYTSSLDENNGAELLFRSFNVKKELVTSPFVDQIAWIKELAGYVSESDDLQLVVRIHPREGNRFHGRISANLKLLRSELKHMPPHCQIVWPEDPVSSYDLGEAADAVLISWSTIGSEFARMGVPVLSCAMNACVYPADDFIEFAPTQAGYFQRLRQLVHQTQSLDTVVRAYRWYYLNHLATGLDFSDVVPHVDFEGLPPYQTSQASEGVNHVFRTPEDSLDYNMAQLAKAQTSLSPQEERAAVLKALQGIVRFLLSGNFGPSDLSIEKVTGANVSFTLGGKTQERCSPLAARLWQLIQLYDVRERASLPLEEIQTTY